MTASRRAAARRYRVEQNLYAIVLVAFGVLRAVRIVLDLVDSLDAGLTLPEENRP